MDMPSIHNRNLGTYAFMGGMVLLNQTREIQRLASEQRLQNVILGQQLQRQAVEASRHKVVLDAIKSVEELRLKEEREDRDFRRREAGKLKQTRRFLADTLTAFGQLKKRCSSGEVPSMKLELTHALGVIQVHLVLLEACDDVFTDLADLKAYRELKVDVEDYIAAKHAAGEVARHPLQQLVDEIMEIERLVLEAEGLHASCIAAGKAFKGNLPKLDSLDKIRSASIQAAEFEARFFKELQSLRERFRPSDWAENSLRGDLLVVSEMLNPNDGLHLLPLDSISEFVSATGNLYEMSTRVLEQMKASCSELLLLHDQHSAVVEEARIVTNEDEAITARTRLESLDERFSDIGYRDARSAGKRLMHANRRERKHQERADLTRAANLAERGDFREAKALVTSLETLAEDPARKEVLRKCDEQENSLRCVGGILSKTRETIEAQLQKPRWPVPVSLDPRIRRTKRIIRETQGEIQPWLSFIQSASESEYTRELKPLLDEIESILKRAENELNGGK